MKKIMGLVFVASLAILTITGCDGPIDVGSFPLEKPTAEYEIDTWGSNSEVYEFTPKTNPGYTCVFVILDSGDATALQCFPKPVVAARAPGAEVPS